MIYDNIRASGMLHDGKFVSEFCFEKHFSNNFDIGDIITYITHANDSDIIYRKLSIGKIKSINIRPIYTGVDRKYLVVNTEPYNNFPEIQFVDDSFKIVRYSNEVVVYNANDLYDDTVYTTNEPGITVFNGFIVVDRLENIQTILPILSYKNPEEGNT